MAVTARGERFPSQSVSALAAKIATAIKVADRRVRRSQGFSSEDSRRKRQVIEPNVETSGSRSQTVSVFTLTALGPKEAECELWDVICTLANKR